MEHHARQGYGLHWWVLCFMFIVLSLFWTIVHFQLSKLESQNSRLKQELFLCDDQQTESKREFKIQEVKLLNEIDVLRYQIELYKKQLHDSIDDDPTLELEAAKVKIIELEKSMNDESLNCSRLDQQCNELKKKLEAQHKLILTYWRENECWRKFYQRK